MITANIDTFYGLNEAAEPDGCRKMGESSVMENFRIADDGSIVKRGALQCIVNRVSENSPVTALTVGSLKYAASGSDDKCIFYIAGGSLYAYGLTTGTLHTIALLTAWRKNHYVMFIYGRKLYLFDDNEYYCYDGSTFNTVSPYIPTLFIDTDPQSGIGTAFEEANMLSPMCKAEYTCSEATTAFWLPESAARVALVTVNGVTAQFTFSGRCVTLSQSAAAGSKVIITWSNDNSVQKDEILANRYCMFYSGKNDTAVFLWGDEGAFRGARRRFSAVDNPTYFPKNSYTDVGDGTYPITDIVRQYDRQIIFTSGDIYYSYMQEDGGEPSFPVYPLCSETGNKIYGGVQIINNNPVFLGNGGIYELTSTNVRDERNIRLISDAANLSLGLVGKEYACTYDFKRRSELIICYGGVALIYNYNKKAWYKFTGITAKGFFELGDDLCFHDEEGALLRLTDEAGDDYSRTGSRAVFATLKLCVGDFGKPSVYKYGAYIYAYPRLTGRLSLRYSADGGQDEALGTMENYDNPKGKPLKFRLPARRFDSLYIIISGESENGIGGISRLRVSVNTAGNM